MAAIRNELRDELDRARFLQFAFFEQWRALHTYGRGKGVKIIGDVAIFVSYDSADVWTHPDIFRLNADTLEPECVAGVPPDAFSETGQRWGNPLYRWTELKQQRLRLVGQANELGACELRHYPPRSLPRISAILGDSQ